MPRTGKRTNNVKVTLSVNPHVVALAKEAAKANGMTLSAFVNQSMIDLTMYYARIEGLKKQAK